MYEKQKKLYIHFSHLIHVTPGGGPQHDCNFTQEYPSNHPEVITDQSSIDYTLASYKAAIVKATVIPP